MTYEYLCTACAHAWEAEQKMSEKPLTTCPNCHTENAKRQVSGGAGFILKGGGWYADLYGSAPKKPASEGAGGGATSSEKTASAPKKDAGTSDGATKPKVDASASSGASTSTGTSGSGGSSSPAGSKPPGASAA